MDMYLELSDVREAAARVGSHVNLQPEEQSSPACTSLAHCVCLCSEQLRGAVGSACAPVPAPAAAVLSTRLTGLISMGIGPLIWFYG